MTVTVADAVDAFVDRKAVGEGSTPGTYATNAASILSRWVEWLEDEHDCTALEAVTPSHLEAYATALQSRASSGEYTASTAHTYYAVVRAFLTWCVEGGLLEENPADSASVRSRLPERSGTAGKSAWSPAQRRALERHVEERAIAAEGGPREDRLARLRDAALVAMLTSTGLRGAELFRVPEDDRRSGATWDDVDFYEGTITVLGTSQRLEAVPIPASARTPLRRYRTVLDPPTNDWPLFPTRHAPSIAATVRSTLSERGHTDEETEDILGSATARAVSRQRSIAPPAITTEGARSILRRLCDEAGIDVDGETLTPRGARLGVGETERSRASPTAPVLRTIAEQAIAPLEDEDE